RDGRSRTRPPWRLALPAERLDVQAGEVAPTQSADAVERRVRRDQGVGLRRDRGSGENGIEGNEPLLPLEQAQPSLQIVLGRLEQGAEERRIRPAEAGGIRAIAAPRPNVDELLDHLD